MASERFEFAFDFEDADDGIYWMNGSDQSAALVTEDGLQLEFPRKLTKDEKLRLQRARVRLIIELPEGE